MTSLAEEGSGAFEAGDLVWIDLDPRVGREQSRRRPALVISPSALWLASRFLMVCPITSRIRPFASSVVLPDGLPVKGEILTSQLRSIDTLARVISPVGARVPHSILLETRLKIAALLGIEAQNGMT